MSPRAALSGSLLDLSISDLLGLVSSAGHSGVIEFSGVVEGIVSLADGSVTLALTDDGPSLQQVVIGSGITDTDGWETAQALSRRGSSLGTALVEGGADDELLEAALREQTVSALFELLLPSATEFVFVSDATHPLGDRYHFDHVELIAEARARLDAWKEIAEIIPTTEMVMRIRRELPETSVTIGAGDWRVLALVDGHTTIADVIRALGTSAFTVCGVLHRLVLAGCVEPVPG